MSFGFWQLFRCVAVLGCIESSAMAQTLTPDPTNQTVTPDMLVLPLHLGGRVAVSPIAGTLPPGALAYMHEWPGLYFEAAFVGHSVTLKFDDEVNEYRLLIDDLPPIPIAQPGAVEIKVTDLLLGPHRLRLEKVTESIDLTGSFAGFYVLPDAQPEIAPSRSRQIEFIGDSDMTGYGIRSSSRICTPEQVRLLSDTQAAYPALVARHFDADYQVNAISGRGMVRNYDGFDPNIAMPFVYPFSLPSAGIAVTGTEWNPQIIYIALGGNDFATPLHAGENWADTASLIADFTNKFSAFVTDLHADHPNATILIALPYGPVIPEVQTAEFIKEFETALLTTAGQIGLTRIDFLTLIDTKPESTACDYHPSVRDQQNRAAWLTGYLDDHPALWGTP